MGQNSSNFDDLLMGATAVILVNQGRKSSHPKKEAKEGDDEGMDGEISHAPSSVYEISTFSTDVNNAQKHSFFCPEVYDLLLRTGDKRTYKLNFFQRLFLTLKYPGSCMLALWYSRFMIALITASLISLIMSTTKDYRYHPNSCYKPACNNDPVLCPGYMICAPIPLPGFNEFETFVLTMYSLDLFLRLSTVPFMPARLSSVITLSWDQEEAIVAAKERRKPLADPILSKQSQFLRYFFSFGTAVDLVAILPTFIYLCAPTMNSENTAYVRVLRLLRMFRLYRFKGGNGFTKIIAIFRRTIVKSLDSLIVLGFLFLFAVVIFGCIMYSMENGTFTVNSTYPQGVFLRAAQNGLDVDITPYVDIPSSMYWAVVTLSTLGYGDLYPYSSVGRTNAGVCAIIGMFLLALPMNIFSSHFMNEYVHYEEMQKMAEDAAKRKRGKLAIEDGADPSSEYREAIIEGTAGLSDPEVMPEIINPMYDQKASSPPSMPTPSDQPIISDGGSRSKFTDARSESKSSDGKSRHVTFAPHISQFGSPDDEKWEFERSVENTSHEEAVRLLNELRLVYLNQKSSRAEKDKRLKEQLQAMIDDDL